MSRSINESIQTLESSLTDIKNSLKAKNVEGGEQLKVSQVSGLIDQIESGGADLLSSFDKAVHYGECLVIVIGDLNANDSDVSISSVKYGNNLDQNYSTSYVAKIKGDSGFYIYMLLCDTYMKKVKLTEVQSDDMGDEYNAATDEIDVSQRNVIIANMHQLY